MVPWVPKGVDHQEAKAPRELSQHPDLASPALDTVAGGSEALQTFLLLQHRCWSSL